MNFTWLLTLVAFVVIFGVVVISHEFGHFLVAKANGIHVVEFSVGMGPKIVGFQRKETLYAIRALPIGGACMFEGEDGLAEEEDKEEDSDVTLMSDNGKEKKGTFPNAPVAARIATVLAGPVFNIVLAFILSVILVSLCGSDPPVVSDISAGYPAQEAGICAGDKLISLNGEKVYLYREVILITMINKGEPIEIVYERDGEQFLTTIVPKLDEESGSYRIGVVGGTAEKYTGFSVVKYSWYEVRYWLKATIKSLKMLFTGNVSFKDVAGPVGIAQVINTTIEKTWIYGFLTVMLNMINIAVLLSVNLGVMNLLPVPALDGGRLVLLVVEAIRRKPLPGRAEMIINLSGFVCLMILMVVVFFSDVFKLFM